MSPTWGQAVLVSAATRRSRGSAPLCAHSPSGCTFWGKRPWSRTRRILWQLGMVLGAPMVISLAAGVAVPVITIGIPIYMGRKVLAAVVLLPAEPGSPAGRPWPGQTCSAPCCPQHIPVPPLPCQDLLLPPAAPASAGVLSLGSGSGWVKGGRVLDGLCRNTCAVVAVLWWLPVPGEREGWLWLELCQAGKGLSPWGCVFVVPFTFLSCPRGAGPEPAEQPLRVPAVPLCHQQCPPVSLCVPHHNSSHCG